jgi:DNA-binding CsgD family transcriptional regulator
MTNCQHIISDLINSSDKVKKVTQPLRNHFEISYFYYYRIDNAGRLTFLSDHPQVEEYYFSEKIYLNDPYMRHPSNYQSGFLRMESNGNEDYRDDLSQTTGVFNLRPWLSLLERNSDSFDFFGFWRHESSFKKTEKIHLNHSELLKAFTHHFKKELEPSLLQMKEAAYLVPDLVGKEHFYSNMPIIPTIEKESLRAYLIEMGLGREVLKADSLSSREKQCLHGLLDCKSAKDIAFNLGLSTRTVENHLDRIKCKLSCWSKQQLFSCARKLKELGLL